MDPWALWPGLHQRGPVSPSVSTRAPEAGAGQGSGVRGPVKGLPGHRAAPRAPGRGPSTAKPVTCSGHNSGHSAVIPPLPSLPRGWALPASGPAFPLLGSQSPPANSWRQVWALEAPSAGKRAGGTRGAPTSCLSLHRPLDEVGAKHGLLDLTVLHQVKGHHEGAHGVLPLGQKDDLQRERTRTITGHPAARRPIAPRVASPRQCGAGSPSSPGEARLQSQKTVPLSGST